MERQVITRLLPLDRPMQLEVNVSCLTGCFCAEVLYPHGTPVEGYGPALGQLEALDVWHQMTWDGCITVSPVPNGLCRFGLTLFHGSLFSHRWSRVPKFTQSFQKVEYPKV
ncbi:MAG: hypothetical protein DRQ02_08245 [Candidatus Latescibacterota bacterium]|nr:MAG: hypothetical protein DRQ02_08245 [Candidatus Latescibacterota bacterium]